MELLNCNEARKKKIVIFAIASEGTERLLVLLTKVQLPLPKEDETNHPIQQRITRLVTSSTTIHHNNENLVSTVANAADFSYLAAHLVLLLMK